MASLHVPWCICTPGVRSAALKVAIGRYQRNLILGIERWSSRTRSKRFTRLANNLVWRLYEGGFHVTRIIGLKGGIYLKIINLRHIALYLWKHEITGELCISPPGNVLSKYWRLIDRKILNDD